MNISPCPVCESSNMKVEHSRTYRYHVVCCEEGCPYIGETTDREEHAVAFHNEMCDLINQRIERAVQKALSNETLSLSQPQSLAPSDEPPQASHLHQDGPPAELRDASPSIAD